VGVQKPKEFHLRYLSLGYSLLVQNLSENDYLISTTFYRAIVSQQGIYGKKEAILSLVPVRGKPLPPKMYRADHPNHRCIFAHLQVCLTGTDLESNGEQKEQHLMS
jgi:hypothetical protein